MSLSQDFINFIDGGCPVPYHMDGVKYVYKPNIVDEVFDYEFKIYYRSYDRYFVGIASSQFVRPIHARDFKLMRKIKEDSTYTKTKKFKQLCFDF